MKSLNVRALGLTNSMDEEVDEDPAAMIDKITSIPYCRNVERYWTRKIPVWQRSCSRCLIVEK